MQPPLSELITQNPLAKITILERGITPLGPSVKNAGFACFGSPTELLADAEKMGETRCGIWLNAL